MKKLKPIAAVLAAAFVIILAVGGTRVWKFAFATVVDPESYSEAGRKVKERFPEYSNMADAELGTKLFSKGYLDPRQYGAMLDRGFTDEQIHSLVERKGKFPLWQSVLMMVGYATALGALYAALLRILNRKGAFGESDRLVSGYEEEES